MDAAAAAGLGVIDPTLLDFPQRSTGQDTNGATFRNPSPSPPRATAKRTTRTFAKADIDSWSASNYAPRRDANETRVQYEERLTHVSRKAPLLEACNKLQLATPRSTNLERIRGDLAKHWFTSLTGRDHGPAHASQRPSAASKRTKRRATDAHDVLASVLVPTAEPRLFPAPAGILPAVSSNARGELRGAVPLFHLDASYSSAAAGSSSRPHRSQPQQDQSTHSSSSSQATALSRQGTSSSFSNPNVPRHREPRMSSAEDSSSAPSSSVFPLLPSAIPSTPRASTSRTDDASESPLVVIPLLQENDEDESDAGLLRAYNVPGADASDLLGYDDEDSDEEDGDGDENGSDSDDGPEDMDAYRRGIRVAAANRAEGNRREGGRRTQSSMVKMWNEFTGKALKAGKIEDHTVDEHSLLLYINFCAERPKRTPKGIEKPGTFLGASQLKKLFFGALRIRKLQDAADPSLAKKRPATSVIVYDSIKTRMDEALERERNGLSPEEDAPDIRANTWLSQVTEQQLKDIGFGFLSHRQLRLAVWGHLAWTAQHASGNRGDDFRALKLAELQPTTLKHPDKRTEIYSVLGLQGEEKAGRRGMKTVINPSYSVFIANIKPEMCPLGGFAFYFHYIYDEKKIVETLNLDYTINKSWRAVRVLHGPKSPTTPFNEGNLYNLYCKAYAHAGFKSRLKAHLPRHLLGYRQQELGVDPLETSKLGWVRGQTYMDTYAPALPKTESLHISAILGAAGYQVDEIYDPTWRRVRVPEAFLRLVCPMAEEMLEKVAGNEHLSGAFNHWEMAIELREYFFQCGAAIWQLVPGSAIFRLPAFQGTDVRNWMTTGYPAELSALDAATGSPVEMERIQNAALQRSLLAMRSLLTNLTVEVRQLRGTVDRRTAIFTPARGFSASVYQRNALAASEFLDDDGPIHNPGTIVIPSGGGSASSRTTPPSTPPRSVARSSPLASSTTHSPRLITQVELVLPPLAAFYQQGAAVGIIHPILGMQSARWVEDVFPAIRQPHMCWSVWGPAKTMDQFEHVREIWDIYAHGERTAVNSDGTETHMKPPLKLVEQFFKHKWRTSLIQQEKQRLKKAWERFREIPEWIDQQSTARRVAPDVIIAELEEMRARDDGSGLRGINWLVQEVASRRKQDKEATTAPTPPSDPEEASGTGTGETKKRATAKDARRPGPSKRQKTTT